MAKQKNPAKTPKTKTFIDTTKKTRFQKCKSVIQNALNIVFSPRKFFKSLVVDGSLDAPIIKALIYGLIGGALTFILQILHGNPTTIGTLFSQFITTPIIALIVLFAFAGIMMLIAEITGGERDFETAVKALASVFFLYPVMLILHEVAFNCTSIWVISLITDLYILFLLYNIGTYCLNGRKPSVKLVIGCLGVLLIMIYATDYRVAWFLMKNATATLSCIY